MFLFDGDDNLIGRQVFTVLNAVFQQRKAKFVYTNNLVPHTKTSDNIIRYDVGYSIAISD